MTASLHRPRLATLHLRSCSALTLCALRTSLCITLCCRLSPQASYLTWGYLQEKVMTTDYTTGRFPSATFCVFSNRVFAIVAAAVAMLLQHGRVHVPAPLWTFAPCSLSNSLSSYGQYQALRLMSCTSPSLCRGS